MLLKSIAPGHLCLAGRWLRRAALFIPRHGLALLLLGLAPMAQAATLSVALDLLPPGLVVDLDSQGTLDWGQWGFFTEESHNHRYGVASQIEYSPVVDSVYAGPYWQGASRTGLSWTNGAPVQSASNSTHAVFFIGASNGFQIICPANTNLHTLKLYVGADGIRARVAASLGDLSAPAVTNTAYVNPGAGSNAVFTIRFQAASPGQTLTALCLLDTDLASGGGGSLTLQGATLAGPDAPPTASILSPTAGSIFTTPANFSVAAGASVNVGVVTNLKVYRGVTLLGQTNGSLLRVALTNQAPNVYFLTAVARGDNGLSSTSSPTTIYVTTGGGILRGTLQLPPTNLDLTVEGRIDWAHWGLATSSNFDHKASVAQQIPNVAALIGSPEDLNQYADNLTAYSWSDGTPTASAAGTHTGIFTYGLGNGFQLTVPATTTLRRLKIYAGLYGAQGKFGAALTDESGPWYSDTSIASAYNNAYGVYTFDFASRSASANLVLRWTSTQLFDPSYGNVTWQAATLAPIVDPANIGVQKLSSTGAFVFSFPTQPGFNYTVYSCDTLAPLSWQPLTNLTGTGTDAWITNSTAPASQRFYRLKAQ